ncbi:hypothetical protein TDB9533_02527 [Thalassocella blandensis]|nr:hypothetical protein TDB9533_02527 [Thalassocella blandensis]
MLALSSESTWGIQHNNVLQNRNSFLHDSLHDRREHYARSALNKHRDDLDLAKQMAELRYREFVRRELNFNEIQDIHALIAELNKWRSHAKNL